MDSRQSEYAHAGTGGWWNKVGFSGLGHLALDVGRMIPFAGFVFDAANAAWYAAEGD